MYIMNAFINNCFPGDVAIPIAMDCLRRASAACFFCSIWRAAGDREVLLLLLVRSWRVMALEPRGGGRAEVGVVLKSMDHLFLS